MTTDVRARTSPGARIGLCNLLCGLGLVLALLSTAGCGTSRFTPGTAIVTMTAKPGRFLNYIVTLDEIALTDNNNNTVVLPVTNQRVDLAHLDRNVNLVQAPAVQVGTYVSATLVVDYSTALINVDFGGGVTSTVTAIDPASGGQATVLTVTVTFDPGHPLVVSNPNSVTLALDIDLEASNLPSLTTAQTIVKPFFTATTTPVYNQPVFVRGLYVAADTANKNFVMNSRPFHDQVNSPFGALTVYVDDQTYYQVNGVTYVGRDGLAAVASLQSLFANLPIGAYGPNATNPFGNLNTVTPSMNATQVYVGSSLESTIADQLTGIVAGVDGNTVVMSNAAFVDRTGINYSFQLKNFPLIFDANTIVSVDGEAHVSPTIQSISTGQFLTANGALEFDVNGTPLAMDVTGATTPGAQIRLQNTTLWGVLSSATPPPGTLSMNLLGVENIEAGLVPIPGASNYPVATGSIDESTVPANTFLKVDGLANPGPPPNFTASAITSPADSQLVLEWSAGTTTAFGSNANGITGGGISINTNDGTLTAGMIRVGPVSRLDFLAAGGQPPNGTLTIAYNMNDPANPPLYGVGSLALGEFWFSDPVNGFAPKAQSLAAANAIYKLVAIGQYDAGTGKFSATSVSMNAK